MTTRSSRTSRSELNHFADDLVGIFGRQTKKYDAEETLPPVPEEEVGEVQNLAKVIWEFENHDMTWEHLRGMHEDGFASATRLYKDRIAISNHILEKYEPRKDS